MPRSAWRPGSGRNEFLTSARKTFAKILKGIGGLFAAIGFLFWLSYFVVSGINMLENLELWVGSHPKSQRVEDQVAWAQEILARYG
jgi:hypothetical protein